MFELPSVWNLIVSTVVFFLAAGYIRRYLDENDLLTGMTRSLLVLTLAYVVSWGAGEAVDWTQEKLAGPQPAAHQPAEIAHLQQDVNGMHP